MALYNAAPSAPALLKLCRTQHKLSLNQDILGAWSTGRSSLETVPRAKRIIFRIVFVPSLLCHQHCRGTTTAAGAAFGGFGEGDRLQLCSGGSGQDGQETPPVAGAMAPTHEQLRAKLCWSHSGHPSQPVLGCSSSTTRGHFSAVN